MNAGTCASRRVRSDFSVEIPIIMGFPTSFVFLSCTGLQQAASCGLTGLA